MTAIKAEIANRLHLLRRAETRRVATASLSRERVLFYSATMQSSFVIPLKVGDERFLVANLIYRRPKKFMLRELYPVHAMTRKVFGDITRKLSVIALRYLAQFRGTLSRRNSRVVSANSLQVS